MAHHHDRDASRSLRPPRSALSSRDRTRPDDWERKSETLHDSLPYSTRRRDIEERSGSTSKTTTTTSTAAADSSRHRRRSRTSAHPDRDMQVPNPLPRPQNTSHRRGKGRYRSEDDDDDDEESLSEGSESRSPSRSRSRRRYASSPPRSTRYYRSTPESRPSSKTTLTPSISESDLSDRDEKVRKPSRLTIEEVVEDEAGDEDEITVTIEEEEPPKRKHRRRRREREDVVYEQEREMTSKPHYEAVEGNKPARRRSHRHHSESRSSSRRRSRYIDDGSYVSSSKRPSRRYYASDVVYQDKPSLRRSNTTGGSLISSSQSVSTSSKRSSFLGSFFGPIGQHASPEKPVKVVTCLVCLSDDVPSTKTAKLSCGHRMCHSCLKRSFKLSLTDPQQMPPKCCTTDPIPIKHVDRLFDNSFKKNWNRKFAEYSTRNRIYCPARRCGEWIKPENFHRGSDGRKYAKCSSCKTKVCCKCNGKWHSSRDCPRDEDTNEFLEQAKREGWQRCFSCKAMVELKEGCNHMTCRCGAEFCMICGVKWKNCDCPWFNYDAVEQDRLDHMQIPRPVHVDLDGVDGYPPSHRDFRSAPLPTHSPIRPRPQSYEEELHLRRLQEQRDEDLARRLQYDDPQDDFTGMMGEVYGIGNARGHFMNDSYRRAPPSVHVPPPPGSYERGNPPADYVAGVNRARGVRNSSYERRLADRFSESRHSGSPTHRHSVAMPPPPPPPPGAAMAMPGHPGVLPHMPPPPPMLRRHTMEEELYNIAPTTRPSERVVPGRTKRDYEAEAAVHAPPSRSRHKHKEIPKDSMLAGLTGHGKGMHRVFEWRNHVAPGAPGELPTATVS